MWSRVEATEPAALRGATTQNPLESIPKLCNRKVVWFQRADVPEIAICRHRKRRSQRTRHGGASIMLDQRVQSAAAQLQNPASRRNVASRQSRCARQGSDNRLARHSLSPSDAIDIELVATSPLHVPSSAPKRVRRSKARVLPISPNLFIQGERNVLIFRRPLSCE